MNIYKLEKNKINGINIPENSIVCTIQDKISIRLIGESSPFVEARLEEFRDSLDQQFPTQADFITYFNLNFNLGLSFVSNGSLIIQESGDLLAKIILESGGFIYIAEAAAGSLAASAVWRVKKINSTTGTTTWADGNSNFDNIATNLTGLTYA